MVQMVWQHRNVGVRPRRDTGFRSGFSDLRKDSVTREGAAEHAVRPIRLREPNVPGNLARIPGTSHMKVPRRFSRRAGVGHALAALLVAVFAEACASGEPDRRSYQVTFGETPPTTGDDALKTSFGRADTVIKYIACGGEAAFADGSTLRNRPDDHPIYANAEEIGESMIHRAMAKMIVYMRWAQFATGPSADQLVCAQHVEYYSLEPKKNPGDPDVPHPVDLSKLGQQLVDLFGTMQ
jgi:hypothetical protein